MKSEYLDSHETADYGCLNQRMLPIYRKYGMLKFAKLGRSFIYKKSWIDEFMETWAGVDLSNEEKIREAVAFRQWELKHGKA